MTATRCPACRATTHDGGLCPDCTTTLERAIADLAAYLPELGTAVTRLDRVARAARPTLTITTVEPATSKDTRSLVRTPDAINFDAAVRLREVRDTLTHWTRHYAEGQQLTITPGQPDTHGPFHTFCGHRSCAAIRAQLTSDQVITAWWLRHIRTLRVAPRIGEAHRAVTRAAAAVERAIDRTQPDIYAGPCDSPDVDVWLDRGDVIRIEVDRTCDADLYASISDTHVTCTTCGATYPIAERRTFMLEAVRDVWARPGVIANALTTMAVPLTAETLDRWIERDKKQAKAGRPRNPRKQPYPPILQVGIDDAGKPLYRVGDVQDRVAAMQVAKAQLGALKAADRGRPA